ncbi:L-histidine N(alpha)-methyltransferase [Dichotomicrobium thermohalophilum]|uniref:Dimethylhistidine N-methyltransferase n=1 Tax=Dichotomicrobium thermohalophilum TaxID=933063 RepID=A0A397Q9Q4_9HYPH|nr:L-histidine N(alpha)-methyltransferase [Dichotomicrobium thermohalophilum]RIA54981.1 dimethylhistidine N-methyltransferase [Dichotomicrobium thermohalophilum]
MQTIAQAQATIQDDFATEVLNGLSRRPRSIPCRFLYDARGSELFEQITGLEEYYPTRTEIGLLERHADDIAEMAGEDVAIVEFGSGSSRKTEILIAALPELDAYVAIDISAAALSEAAIRLRERFPGLEVITVTGDFNDAIDLPDKLIRTRKLGFFPGSTIGNLGKNEAIGFLKTARELLGADGALLIGVDLKKDESILVPAYDDSEGVTAAFNLNLLTRINRELGGTFDLAKFAHEAIYNAEAGRMEIYITSREDQEVTVLGQPFSFARGERIHTENSHKYALADIAAMAEAAGWTHARAWVDDNNLFSVNMLTQAG